MNLGRPLDTWDERTWASHHRDVARRPVFGSFTWDAPNLAANTTTDTTLTTALSALFDGLRTAMVVSVTPPSTLTAGVVFGGAWVATDRELTIRLGNLTGGAIDPAEATWRFFAWLL
jgi:hypothetical protein